MYILKCYCGFTIFLRSKSYIVKCPRCKRRYLLKNGFRYVLIYDPTLKR